jgi:hypothetical protein
MFQHKAMTDCVLTDPVYSMHRRGREGVIPSHALFEVVFGLLFAHGGDPSELRRVFPTFSALNSADGNEEMPYLHLACLFHENLEVMDGLFACDGSLLQKAVDPSNFLAAKDCEWTPLHILAAECDMELSRVKLLLYFLAHPIHGEDARITVNWAQKDGCTPLLSALRCNSSMKVTVLLQFGAIQSMWTPWKHSLYPRACRQTLATLVMLAKAHDSASSTQTQLVPRYGNAYLYLLPEELLQTVYVFIVANICKAERKRIKRVKTVRACVCQ